MIAPEQHISKCIGDHH